MHDISQLNENEKSSDEIKVSTGYVKPSSVRKLPKVRMLQTTGSIGECSSILTSCFEGNNPFSCIFGRSNEFFGCVTGGSERLAMGVKCKNDERYNMPYSVYLDYLRCIGSDGEAACNEFTKEDSQGREITTKIMCECPEIMDWNGNECGCPSERPYTPEDMETSGAIMLGECCAESLCGEGGEYNCETDECDCAPGMFKDKDGNCKTEATCSPGPYHGEGCDDGQCCTEDRECIEDDGSWDGQGDPDAPRKISECNDVEGRWEMTDHTVCPQEGHCELSTCNENPKTGEKPSGYHFVISECEPSCTAKSCGDACSEWNSNPPNNEIDELCPDGWSWNFNSCDNNGSPPNCLCVCTEG